jgi:hypothetical protein
MPTETRSLHRKLAEVMTEAETIPKSGTAPAAMGGFKFGQVGDAAKAIREALGKRHVSMLPTAVEIVGQSEHPTKSGGTMTTVELRTTWTLTDGESGESIAIQSYGAGADTGDKYSGKAQTNAMKYALLMGFLLSTGDDPEMNDSSDRRTRVIPESAATRVLTAPPKDFGTQPITSPPLDRDPGGITGTAEIGTAKDSDFQLRETPDGWALGFRLVSDKGGIKVIAFDALAQGLAASVGETVGKRVTVWGRIKDEEFTPKGAKRPVRYQVLTLERIKTPEYELPATVAPGQEALELE